MRPSTAELAVYFGTEDCLREKRAGALDIAGRLAAAAVLIHLLDSQRRSPEEVRHAERQVGPVVRDIEQLPPPAHLLPSGRGPRLFVPTQGAEDPEMQRAQYQMGFIPGVPVGMDHGMVRLASAMEKAAAAGLMGRAWNWASGGHAPSMVPSVPNTHQVAPIPKRMQGGNRMLRESTPFQAPNTPVSEQALHNKGLGPKPQAPAPAPAPANAPAASSAPAQGGKISPWGVLGSAAVLGGGALMATGVPKVTGAVLDYGEKEPVTPWGLQPYGATRLNTQVNAYGQPIPG